MASWLEASPLVVPGLLVLVSLAVFIVILALKKKDIRLQRELKNLGGVADDDHKGTVLVKTDVGLVRRSTRYLKCRVHKMSSYQVHGIHAKTCNMFMLQRDFQVFPRRPCNNRWFDPRRIRKAPAGYDADAPATPLKTPNKKIDMVSILPQCTCQLDAYLQGFCSACTAT